MNMRSILSEKNIVVVLFVMVLITFSLAQEDSKKMEKVYSGATTISEDWRLKEPSKITIVHPEHLSGPAAKEPLYKNRD